MKPLDEHIAPDEPILWRTQGLRSFVLDIGKLLALAAGLPVGLALLFSGSEVAAGSLVIPVVASWFAARILLRGPAEALLTGRQLLFRRRIRQPEIQILAPRDIVRLEIFAGDATLVLYGRHGELHRTLLLGDALDLARKLDLPTVMWTPYEPSKRTRRIEYALMVLLPLAVIGFMIAFVGGLPDAFFEIIRTGLSEPARLLTPIWIILAIGAISWPAAVALVGVVRRLVLPRDELNRLRCDRFSPLWQGKDPGAARTGGVLRGARRAFDRAIYGRFPDCGDPEPERYQPGAFPPLEEDEEEAAAPS